MTKSINRFNFHKDSTGKKRKRGLLSKNIDSLSKFKIKKAHSKLKLQNELN